MSHTHNFNYIAREISLESYIYWDCNFVDLILKMFDTITIKRSVILESGSISYENYGISTNRHLLFEFSC